MNNLIGYSLGRYHILEKLGEGGMAVVYKAFDTHLECDVALKVIRTDQLAPAVLERALIRFEREAKEVARLSHPNIVKVTDYGEHEGVPYLVMTYLQGGTLKQMLGNPIPYPEAINLILPIARALDYAHQRKMIHRDVKPSNILIMDSGDVMLTDFGIAKMLDLEDGNTLTGTGMGLGTPEYMAPEQWNGQFTPSVDIYALGVVLYEMITGRKPYSADTPAAVLVKLVSEPLPRPKTLVPGLPDGVERVLVKALQRDPADRYQDMGAFATALYQLERTVNGKIGSQTQAVRETNQKSETSPDTTSDEFTPVNNLNVKSKNAPKSRENIGEKNQKNPRSWLKIISIAAITLILIALVLIGALNGWFDISRKTTQNLAESSSPSATITSTTVKEGRTTIVPANQKWVDSGITLEDGDRVIIKASGDWSFGTNDSRVYIYSNANGYEQFDTNAIMTRIPVGALIGKIGECDPFFIGSVFRLLSTCSGSLYFSMNDVGDSWGFRDNVGFLEVSIEYEKIE